MMPKTKVPSLSIVIPVYNEPDWIKHSVSHAVSAVLNSPFAADAELVIVDDGSDRPTENALAALSPEIATRVIRQENRGRFLARKAGIEAARGELVFLIDSRVLMAPGSLRFITAQLDHERLPAWNGHVEIEVKGNPFGRFWRTVAHGAWPDYLGNPRTMSFGLEEYDRYPKGTGCFIAPRHSLLRALADFRSLYEDSRFSSDDTVLIRSIAAEQKINISPLFACRYQSRDSLRSFLRHSFHRGTTFVDSFGRRGTRLLPVVIAFFPASVAFAVLAMKRPKWAIGLAATEPLVAAAGATALGRPPGDVLAFSTLSGPFAVAYSAGIWRGALLAARARIAG